MNSVNGFQTSLYVGCINNPQIDIPNLDVLNNRTYWCFSSKHEAKEKKMLEMFFSCEKASEFFKKVILEHTPTFLVVTFKKLSFFNDYLWHPTSERPSYSRDVFSRYSPTIYLPSHSSILHELLGHFVFELNNHLSNSLFKEKEKLLIILASNHQLPRARYEVDYERSEFSSLRRGYSLKRKCWNMVSFGDSNFLQRTAIESYVRTKITKHTDYYGKQWEKNHKHYYCQLNPDDLYSCSETFKSTLEPQLLSQTDENCYLFGYDPYTNQECDPKWFKKPVLDSKKNLMNWVKEAALGNLNYPEETKQGLIKLLKGITSFEELVEKFFSKNDSCSEKVFLK